MALGRRGWYFQTARAIVLSVSQEALLIQGFQAYLVDDVDFGAGADRIVLVVVRRKCVVSGP